MAPRWEPKVGAPIDNREPIARRLFEVPRLIGARDQKEWKDTLLLAHFHETRDPGEVSLDRLGQHSVDGKVRSFLLPRAHHAGTGFTPPKDFRGWAWISVGKLRNPPKGAPGFQPVASPVHKSSPDVSDENPYHAHVCRPANTNGWQTATQLRQIFHDHGAIEWVDRKPWVWKYRRWAADRLTWLSSKIGLTKEQ
jgi:hypothetical protein